MYKKVILQAMFGSPLNADWLKKYFDNFAMLEQDGWYLKIFTPNKLEGRSNVEIVPMTLGDFDNRVMEKTGQVPNNYLDGPAPHKLTSDYYPAYGLILEDYIKGFDFWGHTNWDVVYGRLGHFITDELLEDCEIFSDENNEVNGVLTIYRNNDKVNNLFRHVPGWEKVFTEHALFHFDEELFTDAVRVLASAGQVKFKYPKPFPWYSYDRLPQHKDGVNLVRAGDGSLYETFTDFVTKKNVVGREMSFFHFSYTKKYPNVKEI